MRTPGAPASLAGVVVSYPTANLAMIVIEIEPNPNCESVDMRVFNDLEAPQVIRKVRLEHRGQQLAWYEVIGWTTAGRPTAAWVQKVDDSGDGVAFLAYGGDAGLRFRPSDSQGIWSLDDPMQWGEPFLLFPDADDARVQAPEMLRAPQEP